jgi:hypothetical protein
MPAEPPPTWTVDQAVAYFAAAGVPVGPDPAAAPRRLAAIIKALDLRPVGRTPSGPQGGVGKALYSTAELQALHRDLAEWLIRIPDPGPGAPGDPGG